MPQKKQTNGTGKPRGFQPGNTYGNKIKPGEVRNPGGRPKSRNYAAAAREWLDENSEALVAKHGEEALKGDLGAARMLVEHAQGRPRQALDVSVEDRAKPAIDRAMADLVAIGLS